MTKKIEFKDQYKHPKWQKKRLEILERANYTCEECGDKESQLHVHHGYYERTKKLWEYNRLTLWCLCDKCHKKWDKRKAELHFLLALMHLEDFKHLKDILTGIMYIQRSKAIE